MLVGTVAAPVLKRLNNSWLFTGPFGREAQAVKHFWTNPSLHQALCRLGSSVCFAFHRPYKAGQQVENLWDALAISFSTWDSLTVQASPIPWHSLCLFALHHKCRQAGNGSRLERGRAQHLSHLRCWAKSPGWNALCQQGATVEQPAWRIHG